MRGTIPPHPNTPSWCDAELKSTGITLPFTTVSSQRCYVTRIQIILNVAVPRVSSGG